MASQSVSLPVAGVGATSNVTTTGTVTAATVAGTTSVNSGTTPATSGNFRAPNNTTALGIMNAAGNATIPAIYSNGSNAIRLAYSTSDHFRIEESYASVVVAGSTCTIWSGGNTTVAGFLKLANIANDATTPTIGACSGTPEGAVTAPVGSIRVRLDGGATTTLYVKTSGTGNTGWTAK